MRIEISEEIGTTKVGAKSNLLAEFAAYAGLLIAGAAISIAMYQNWDELTKNQRTATFSLLGIALFVSGLIASDTLEARRRFSSFLYIVAGLSSGIAVFVTFTEDVAAVQAFALATVVTLLGYTVSPTMLGHIGLYIATSGTLISLGLTLVESENLQLYTQLSLVIAFAVGWLILSSMRAVHAELGFALGGVTIFASSQYALFLGYQNLSYAIALTMVALFAWLYYVLRSWVLAVIALLGFAVAISEWVIAAMDSSIAALVGMFLTGSLLALVSASAISSARD